MVHYGTDASQRQRKQDIEPRYTFDTELHRSKVTFHGLLC